MCWQQPAPAPGGGLMLREMTHPCTCEAARAAGLWRAPAAEADKVVDVDAEYNEAPGRGGQAAAAAHRLQPGLTAFLAAAGPGQARPGQRP